MCTLWTFQHPIYAHLWWVRGQSDSEVSSESDFLVTVPAALTHAQREQSSLMCLQPGSWLTGECARLNSSFLTVWHLLTLLAHFTGGSCSVLFASPTRMSKEMALRMAGQASHDHLKPVLSPVLDSSLSACLPFLLTSDFPFLRNESSNVFRRNEVWRALLGSLGKRMKSCSFPRKRRRARLGTRWQRTDLQLNLTNF